MIEVMRIAIFLLITLLAVSGPLSSKEPEESWKELGRLSGQERQQLLLTRARAEGEVLWYSTFGADHLKELTEDFERHYAGVKIKVWRSRGEAVSNRMLMEGRAGKFMVDVIGASNEYLPILMKADLIGRYRSPEREFYSDSNKDAEGYWTSNLNTMVVIGYNTNLVPQTEAPKKYEDFLDPKWKGHFALDTNPDRLIMGWVKLWGREKTERVLTEFIKNGPLIRRGHLLTAQLLCAGEFKAAVELYASHVFELKQQGCPMGVVFPNPTFAAAGPISVAKRAPHPYAAALLVDFIFSEHGQTIVADKRFYSLRRGIRPKYPDFDLEKRGIEVLVLRPEDAERLGKEYFEIRERHLLPHKAK
jgi:iron(III) transport system substrate-binding protein